MDFDSPTPASSEEPSKFRDSLNTFYRSFPGVSYAFESHLTRIFVARLDYMLQHQPFSDPLVRLKYMVKRARLLVGSDVADYLHYDGLEDRLKLLTLDRRTAFKSPDEATDQKWDKEVTTALAERFARLAESPEEREKSSAYRALDKRMLVSRFTEHKGGDLHAPFRGPADDEVGMVPAEHSEFPAEKDILAVPVMYPVASKACCT